MKSLVAIIVPMYNEEKNIEHCINVLNSQQNKNFEVCFVDDGSTDNTLKKLKDILKIGVNFNYQVVVQQNQGAAQARKNGIDKVDNQYIMMLDCDDTLSEDYVEKFYEIVNEYNEVDIVIPDMKVQDKAGKWNTFKFFSDDKVLNSYDCLMHTLDGWRIHGIMVIKKAVISQSYKDYLLLNLSNQNFINNDEVITRLNFKNANKVVRSYGVYFYNYNPNSTTKKIHQTRYLLVRNMIIMKSLFASDKNLQDRLFSEYMSTLWGIHRYMKKNKHQLNNAEEWRAEVIQGIRSLKLRTIINKSSFKNKVKLAMLVLNI
jgi:glycosyltransferase involved in cell wall biosynthesis